MGKKSITNLQIPHLILISKIRSNSRVGLKNKFISIIINTNRWLFLIPNKFYSNER